MQSIQYIAVHGTWKTSGIIDSAVYWIHLAIILNPHPHGFTASKLQRQNTPCKPHCQEQELRQIGCRRMQTQQAQARRSLVAVEDDLVTSGTSINFMQYT